MKKTLLITSAWNDKNAFQELERNGFKLSYASDNEDYRGDASDVFAIVCNSFFSYNSIKKFDNLKCIQLTSSGLDRIPVDEIKKRNIVLYNARGVYSIPIAEFVISGLLDLLKNKKTFFENQRKKKWVKIRNLDELHLKKVAIFGCGSVGEEIAKRLKAFGCYVCGFDTKIISSPFFDSIFSVEEYKQQLNDFDIQIISMPLTKTTEHFCDETFFSLVKDDSIFVNVARGAIVEEEALIHAIKTKLAGAVIDVFESEPLSNDSELWNEPNVILTPHNSYASKSNLNRLSSLILGNLKNYV